MGSPRAASSCGATVRHIVRNDPARALREVEAKRRLLDLHKLGRYGECVTCDVGAQS
ncbi:DUF6221 family protein, partial [Nonomuraea sp. NPDC049400]|uniref:DUF6221 family protein n=1 Tax=Nonomuraea sp. NPDC049400 TaxID=3364352 RepID=UPI0037BAF04C